MDRPYAELEIGLHRIQAESYQVELRFTNPTSEAETVPHRAPCLLDPEALTALQLDPPAYGERLTSQLFSDDKTLASFQSIKTAVETADLHLRVRLPVGTTAQELHALRWELLTEPDTKAPLATSEKVLFSRFMLSQDWRTVSAPSNLAKYNLAPVDLEGEVRRARENLAGIEVDVLGKDEPLTLNLLDQRLREGGDFLYLVCHGALADRQQPYLFLQDESGAVQRVHGDDLAVRISEMLQPPRLVVLASCESAGTGPGPGSDQEKVSVQASLAPRLADSGVAAVVAMQGKVGTETVERAMPVFFAELLQDGQIDRAMAVARGAVRDRYDAWMPAPFLRLRGGRIWYEPGFRAGEDDAVKWRTLVNDISNKRFTPIVGWGLAERIYGSTQDLAQRLAMANHFPLAPYQRTDLPQVSQYRLVNQRSSSYPLDALNNQMRGEIYARHRDALLPEDEDAPLSQLLNKTSGLLRRDEQDVYRILAGLPARVFVTATYEKEPTAVEPLVYRPRLERRRQRTAVGQPHGRRADTADEARGRRSGCPVQRQRVPHPHLEQGGRRRTSVGYLRRCRLAR